MRTKLTYKQLRQIIKEEIENISTGISFNSDLSNQLLTIKIPFNEIIRDFNCQIHFDYETISDMLLNSEHGNVNREDLYYLDIDMSDIERLSNLNLREEITSEIYNIIIEAKISIMTDAYLNNAKETLSQYFERYFSNYSYAYYYNDKDGIDKYAEGEAIGIESAYISNDIFTIICRPDLIHIINTLINAKGLFNVFMDSDLFANTRKMTNYISEYIYSLSYYSELEDRTADLNEQLSDVGFYDNIDWKYLKQIISNDIINLENQYDVQIFESNK